MEETIRLKCDKTGRLKIRDHFPTTTSKIITTERLFSTPDKNGTNFGRLFTDVKEGDIIEVTFKNVRICSQCGKKIGEEK